MSSSTAVLDLDLLADRKVILAAVGTVVLAVVVASSVTVSKEELLQRINTTIRIKDKPHPHIG